MKKEEREILEANIKEQHQRGNFRAAVSLGLKGYGPELLGFLMAMLRNEQDATEVFSQFCEDLWKGIEGFRWQASFRTWAYTLARNAVYRFSRVDRKRLERQVPLDDERDFAQVVDRVRSATLPFLRTEVKDRFTLLRESLPTEDQSLLILRIDRKMSWKDVALVLSDEETAGDSKALRSRAASLRKRFERVKEKLRKMALAEGILKA